MNYNNAGCLISVVLPCFNAEQHLDGVIASVLRQEHENFELLCVNDASTDRTLEILNRYEKMDRRIRCIDLAVNAGLGEARNKGVESSKGDYISFIDSDDTYEPDFLSKLLQLSLSSNADISQVGMRYIWADRNSVTEYPEGCIVGEQCKVRIDCLDGKPYLSPQAWNKLYKRSVFFPNGEQVCYKSIYYEDSEILPRLLKNASSFCVSAEPLYNYFKSNSVITGFDNIFSRFPRYLDSLFISLEPYLDDGFLSLCEKYETRFPVTFCANLNNVLKSIIENSSDIIHRDRRILVETLCQYLKKNVRSLTILPDRTWMMSSWQFASKLGESSIFEHEMLASGGFLKTALDEIHKRQHVESSKERVQAFEKQLVKIDHATPKNKNVWVFATWGRYGHTMDNVRAIFEVVKNDKTIKKVILCNDNMFSADQLEGENVEILPLRSIEGLKKLTIAGVFVTGYSFHRMFGQSKLVNSHDRKIVQAWHGIPVKKVGLQALQEKHWESEIDKYAFIPASSAIDVKTMVDSMAPNNPERIIMSGLPRHDFLGMPEEQLPGDYKKSYALLSQRCNKKKLVLLAPTWKDEEQYLLSPTVEQYKMMEKILERNSAVLGVRSHPNARNSTKSSIPYLSDTIFDVCDIPDVNIILRYASVLITDYSSVFLDFMKLDRPVLLYTPDIENYVRGFNYGYEEFSPHDPINEFEDLLEKMEMVLKTNLPYGARYREVKDRFHKYPLDSGNARRFLISSGLIKG